MRIKLLNVIVITTIITIPQTHTMNLSSSKQSDNQQLTNYELQLNIPDDALDRIIASCPYRTRCYLQQTCKQLYHLAAINRLDKLIVHDFNIGDVKEQKAFFKGIIKNNNPEYIPMILNFAQKDAELQSMVLENNGNVIISLDTHKEFVQQHYLNPLTVEATKQKNKIMINALIENGADGIIVDEVKKTIREKRNNKILTVYMTGCMIIIIPSIIAGFILGPILGSVLNHQNSTQ